MAAEMPEPSAGTRREEAIPLLFAEVGPGLYRFAVRMCGSADEAEDLVQEVFSRAWRAWDDFEGRSRAKTWLFRIAAHTCQRMHRRRSGEPERMASYDELLPSTEALMPPAPTGNDPSEEAMRAEAIERVQEAVLTLPDDFRMPVLFKDVLGLSVEETGAALGVNPQTVKTRLHRARLRLRKALVESLPQRDAPRPSYSQQVCLDLLNAKQHALDEGTEFPVPEFTISERCQSVVDTLDLTCEACRGLIEGGMPDASQRRVLASLSD